jgi:hypothetical protein
MRIDDEVISGILFADTDSESGAEVSEQKVNYKKKKKMRRRRRRKQAKHRLQNVADYQHGDRLMEGTLYSSFVGPAKGVNKSEAPHINTDSLPLSVLILFFTESFQLLVEQTNL